MGYYDAKGQAAAQRAHDNAYPYDDAEEARQEAIGERADELVAERMADDKRVQDAIADALGDDYDDRFASLLRRFFIAFDAAQTDDRMADAGNSLFSELRPHIESAIRADALLDAEAEQARFEANAP